MTDAIDRALTFLDNLERLGDQLKKAEQQQQFYLRRMLEIERHGNTKTLEYVELEAASLNLENMIGKWKPIYQERLRMVKEVKESHKK